MKEGFAGGMGAIYTCVQQTFGLWMPLQCSGICSNSFHSGVSVRRFGINEAMANLVTSMPVGVERALLCLRATKPPQ